MKHPPDNPYILPGRAILTGHNFFQQNFHKLHLSVRYSGLNPPI